MENRAPLRWRGCRLPQDLSTVILPTDLFAFSPDNRRLGGREPLTNTGWSPTGDGGAASTSFGR